MKKFQKFKQKKRNFIFFVIIALIVICMALSGQMQNIINVQKTDELKAHYEQWTVETQLLGEYTNNSGSDNGAGTHEMHIIDDSLFTFCGNILIDKIDFYKTNVTEKRIDFIDEDNPAKNLIAKNKCIEDVLTSYTDYNVSFDKIRKILKVTSIVDSQDNKFDYGRYLIESLIQV